MDRRVVFVAEPGPLLVASHYGGSNREGCGVAGDCCSNSSRAKVRQDLVHLRGVIDVLSAYCLHHQHQQPGPQRKEEKEKQDAVNSNGTAEGVATVAAAPTLPQPVRIRRRFTVSEAAASSKSGSGGGGKGCGGRRVMLAAAFPCPAPAFLLPVGSDHNDNHGEQQGHQQRRQQEQRRTDLAAAFADALESCGTWLAPEDFKARVLDPTRGLVDLQLEDLDDRGDVQPRRHDANADGNLPASACGGDPSAEPFSSALAAGAYQGSFPAGTEGSRSHLSLSCDADSGAPAPAPAPASASAAAATAAAAEAKDFIQSAADEMSVLVKAAAASAGPRKNEMGGESERTESGAPQPRSCMFDVLWAAASPPVEDNHGGRINAPSTNAGQTGLIRLTTAGADEAAKGMLSGPPAALSPSVSSSAPSPPPSPPPLQPTTLTLSGAFDQPRSEPLRAAFRHARAHFPRARFTIWPAGMHTPASVDGGRYEFDNIAGGTIGVGGGTAAAVLTKVEEASAGSGQKEGRPPPAPCAFSGGDVSLRRQRQQWAPWCASIGAGLSFSVPGGSAAAAAIEAKFLLEPGLLWRGPIVAGAACPPRPPRITEMNAGPTQREASGAPPAEACAGYPAAPPPPPALADFGSDVCPGFPALEGFGLRAVVAAGDVPSANGGGNGGSCGFGSAAGGGSAARAVAPAAARILGRAQKLRLARAISPGEIARVCHLLADGDVAPTLELFVEDEDRFPGSAEFLRGWASDGRGMLLVAASAAGGGMGIGTNREAVFKDGWNHRGGGGGCRGEEGLAMICFPRRTPCRTLQHRTEGGSASDESGDDAVGCDHDGGAEGCRGGSAKPVWSVTLFRRPSEFTESAVSALVGPAAGGVGSGAAPNGVGVGDSEGIGEGLDRLKAAVSSAHKCQRRLRGLENRKKAAAGSGFASHLPVYTSAALLAETRRFLNTPQPPQRPETRGHGSNSEAGAAKPSSPAPRNGSAATGRKRRRTLAASTVGSSCRGGSRRKAADTSSDLVPSPSSPEEEGGLRRSSRFVRGIIAAEDEAATTAREVAATLAGDAGVARASGTGESSSSSSSLLSSSSRRGRGARLRGKTTDGGDAVGGGGDGTEEAEAVKGVKAGGGGLEVKLEETEAVSPPRATLSSKTAPVSAEEGALNAMMDDWAAQLPNACGSSRGSSPLFPGRQARVEKGLEGLLAAGGGGIVGLDGDDRRPEYSAQSPSSPPLAYALYGSFGGWSGEAGPSGPGAELEFRDYFWAEELLLPDDGSGRGAPSRSGRIGLPTCGGDGCLIQNGGESATAAAAEADAAMESRSGPGVEPSRRRERSVTSKSAGGGRQYGSGPTSAHGSNSDSGGGCGSEIGVETAVNPQPLQRSLSTAEGALEKARQKQRARAKERRAVAREQRARMDRPRARLRPPAGGSGDAVSASRAAAATTTAMVAGGLSGGSYSSGGFRRRGSIGAPPPPSLAMVGRSSSFGSKLSRGSLIVGRPVPGSTGGSAMAVADAMDGGSGDGGVGGGGGGSSGGANGSLAAGSRLGFEASEEKQQRQQHRRLWRGGTLEIASSVASASSSSWAPSSGAAVARCQLANAGAEPGVGSTAANTEFSLAASAAASATYPAAAGPGGGGGGGGLSGRVRRAIFQDPPSQPTVPQPVAAAAARERRGVDAAGMRPIDASRMGRPRTEGVGGGSGTGASGRGIGAAGMDGGGGGGSGGSSVIRQVMERAMLAAVAAQMGLPENHPSVREVFERESRRISGGGGGGGGVEEQ